jgi:hypothetical protein
VLVIAAGIAAAATLLLLFALLLLLLCDYQCCTMDIPEEVVQQLIDIQVRWLSPALASKRFWVPDNTLARTPPHVLMQSALDSVEEHLQPFLEAGPKQITAQVWCCSRAGCFVDCSCTSKPAACSMRQTGRYIHRRAVVADEGNTGPCC